MSDTKNTDDKSTSMAPKKTLTLSRRTVEQGTVKQSFSHGRTKAVVVETKKSRKHGEGGPLESAQSTQTAIMVMTDLGFQQNRAGQAAAESYLLALCLGLVSLLQFWLMRDKDAAAARKVAKAADRRRAKGIQVDGSVESSREFA